jgi:bifunctional non-homologous end joining protein LigD
VADLAKLIADLRPMLLEKLELHAVPANADDYAFEAKYDGYRAFVYRDADGIRVISRKGVDFTHVFPELAGLADVLPVGTLLDGEVVAFGADGRPSWANMLKRGPLRNPLRISLAAKRIPVHFMAFDVLYVGGIKVADRDYLTRREVLEGLGVNGASWRTASYHVGDGEALFAASCAMNLEGLVAKRLSAAYIPGTRSSTWLKIKNPRYVR